MKTRRDFSAAMALNALAMQGPAVVAVHQWPASGATNCKIELLFLKLHVPEINGLGSKAISVLLSPEKSLVEIKMNIVFMFGIL
jgi:hypothetical protein